MNIYGCIPASFLPSHSTLTYWTQAVSLAGISSSDPALMTPNSLALGLKKSHLPLNLYDVIRKSTGETSLRAASRANEDTSAAFRLTTSKSNSAPSPAGVGENFISFEDREHLQLQLQIQMQQLQRHHHQQQQHQQDRRQRSHHQPFSVSSPPPVGNGIAPLQALCDSDVSAFQGKSPIDPGTSDALKVLGKEENPARRDGDGNGLKFGINRILSDDFGKAKKEKENSFQLSSVPEECRSLPLCPCSSAQCTAYAPRPLSPATYTRVALPSLSAVHALQPPCYPLSNAVDALPGPYSILSSDPASNSNQPKRKRSWSRAVFSNLQRKGLEKRFEVQKYVTKPDRRQLAAMLGLTDAQVKVWFQNRRMKWRHAQQQQGDKDKQDTESPQSLGEHEEMSESYSQADLSVGEGGLDLRRVSTTEEPSILMIDSSSGEPEASQCSSADDTQSPGNMTHGQSLKPDGLAPTRYVSPAIQYTGLVPTEATNTNLLSPTALMSFPKSDSKCVSNLEVDHTDARNVLPYERKTSSLSGTGDVMISFQRYQPSRNPVGRDMQGLQNEPDSSAMSKSPVLPVHRKAGYDETASYRIESSGDAFENKLANQREEGSVLKNFVHEAAVTHIDFSN